ncbi:hypothetical protein DEU38_101270 [Rhodococcus sp. AG1013]|nr:hypothetical protein DEU38_101270 [Rhodococcus sp. AG1013]
MASIEDIFKGLGSLDALQGLFTTITGSVAGIFNS